MAGSPSSDRIETALLKSYVSGRPLALDELMTLADQLWRQPEKSEEFVARVLLEPPQPLGIIAPKLLIGVLLQIRRRLAAEPHLSPSDTDAYNTARERLAICRCVIDSSAREHRLHAGYRQLTDTTAHDDVTRTTSALWIASLARVLSTEFGYDDRPGEEHMVPLGRDAFAVLARGSRDPVEQLRFLCGYLELALRQMRREFAGAADADARARAWSAMIAAVPAALVPAEPDVTATAEERFNVALRRVLLLTFAKCDVEPVDAVDQCIALYRSPFSLNQSMLIDSLDLVFDAMLTLVRARASLKMPVPNHARSALGRLKAAIVTQRSTEESLPTLRDLSKPPAAFAESPPVRQVDLSALDTYIDRLVSRPGTERRGMALSGGGFRAACFHMGVLACLAERDELRELDALSCVSGGSIAGAAYAVRLKTLFAQKMDLEITRADYVQVVGDVIGAMGQVVSSNLRMRAFANPWAVARMCFAPSYTLTERIAELLDKLLFAPLIAAHPAFAGRTSAELAALSGTKKRMTQPGNAGYVASLLGTSDVGWPLGPWDLAAAPRGESADAGIQTGRRLQRLAKVTEVMFNTTSVNTGMGFTFFPHVHGERPDPVAADLSSRPRFTWIAYDDITAGAGLEPDRLHLSRIVAASASVPGFVPPILLKRNDQDAQIALADGGLFDNQGTDQLLDSRCNHIIVSDASGQLIYDAYPDVGGLSVTLRATDILMERVRELGYKRVVDAVALDKVDRITHLHLTKGVSARPPSSIYRPDDAYANRLAELMESVPTDFGVQQANQVLLARMRTDLDCFSEVEVHSLMLDGYLQARQALAAEDRPQRSVEPHPWPFHAVSAQLRGAEAGSLFRIILQSGSRRFLRLPAIGWLAFRETSWGRRPLVRGIFLTAAVVGTAVGSGALLVTASQSPATPTVMLAALLLAVFTARLSPGPWKRWVTKIAGSPILLVAMVYAWCVLLAADPIYRRIGRSPPGGGKSPDPDGTPSRGNSP